MKKVIVAPLNWGLGHAARCIPIIKALLVYEFQPVLASDGNALLYLQKEFPELETLILPSYNIRYAKNLKWHLLLQTPAIQRAVASERRAIEHYIDIHNNVVGVISDNRFGVRSTKKPSVYITHQLTVLSGWTSFLTSLIHRRIVRKFDQCWVPDEPGSVFSGKLSQSQKVKTKFIGPLSRFKKEEKEKKYDVAVILSGIEPHRTILEKKISLALSNYNGKVILIKGIIENIQKKEEQNGIACYNYMLSQQLEEVLNTSEVVISRAGYSSVMDYAILGKKAVLIPTKNQSEQEYLATYLARKRNIVCINENKFSIADIEKAKKMKGLLGKRTVIHKELFGLFERK